MTQAKAEKTIHEALQPPSDQDANVITIGQWFSLMIREEPESFVSANVNVEASYLCFPVGTHRNASRTHVLFLRAELVCGRLRAISWSRSSHVGLRSSVATARERFGIPGSIREDRTAAWQETARAIRQMRRHLKIDNAKCGTVNALSAYIV
ncbi:unnamed protein product [Peronospora destructor]|uniref:Uncharacterized protein n=1 Tax=Peronospora destructor TaxID=86335 RepID=A0AAV0TLH7_9STRA|nr:unnamed protein product [Peronospora destructor]